MRSMASMVGVAALTLACSRGGASDGGETATTATATAQTTEVTPEPVDLRSFELDTQPDREAEAGQWVRCEPSKLDAGTHQVDVCTQSSQTWLAPHDRLRFVVKAQHADEVTIAGKLARFVEGVARSEIELRAVLAHLTASAIGPETKVPLGVVVSGVRGTLRGEVMLVTARALNLVASIGEAPLRFEGEAPDPLPEEPRALVLKPGREGVLAASDGTLDMIDVIAVDRGQSVALPTCPGTQTARSSRPIELTLYARKSGKIVGDLRWPAPMPPCEAGTPSDPRAVAGPSPGDVLAAVIAAVKTGTPERAIPTWGEPRAEDETVVKEGGKADVLRRFWHVAGLDPNSRESDVVARAGEPATRTPVEERTLAQWSGGLAVMLVGERVRALTFAGVTIEKALGREAGVPELLGLELAEITKALGMPATSKSDLATWALRGGGWILEVGVELEGGRATTVHVRWSPPVPRDDAIEAKLGFDPGQAAPMNEDALKRLERFLGLGPASGRGDLWKVFGKGDVNGNVGGGGGKIETHTFGDDLGAQVDTESGKLIEVWVVGASGVEALRKKGHDDEALALVGKRLAEAVQIMGKPSRIGEGFVSWTLEGEALTTYLELQCDAAWLCNELDVGWIVKAP